MSLGYSARSYFYQRKKLTRPIDFNKLRDISDVARAYGFSEDLLRFILEMDESLRYEEMWLPKKNRARRGEYRVVYKARFQSLSLLQKNIATSIGMICKFPDYVQGFVAGRSIVSNASMHLGKENILKSDIRHFFETISLEQVKDVFIRLGCAETIADIFANICTHQRRLPQGASTSPILSNLVCMDMDEDFNNLGISCRASYSRYADDITFSGSIVPSKESIERILNEHGFNIHPGKFFVAKRGKSQYVTGLSVFDNKIPRVAKRMKRRLRLELHYIQKNGMVGHLKSRTGTDKVSRSQIDKEGARITGWIDFISMVEPDVGRRFKSQWIEILGSPKWLNYFRQHRG